MAAHLESEILIVDEVLAVGDAAFQKKCLNKMHQLASQGRTVLFVSHNLLSIQHLCDRALFFEGGSIRADGAVDEVISQYEKMLGDSGRKKEASSHILFDSPAESTTESVPDVQIRRIEMFDAAGGPKSRLETGESMTLRISLYARHRVERASIEVIIGTSYGADLLQLFTELQGGMEFPIEAGHSEIEVSVAAFPRLPVSTAWRPAWPSVRSAGCSGMTTSAS